MPLPTQAATALLCTRMHGGFSHSTNRVIGGLAYIKHSIESERSVATLNQNLKADYSAHTKRAVRAKNKPLPVQTGRGFLVEGVAV